MGLILRVRDVEKFFFCPMVFYFSVVLNLERVKGEWADIGRDVQKDVEAFVFKLFRVIEREYKVESKRLGVRGKIDFVIENGDGIAPLEVKYSKKLKPWWKYSAILYGILLEEKLKRPVKNCYVYLSESNRISKIKIDDEDRLYVQWAIKRCFEIIKGRLPKPAKSKSCESCDYRHLCSY